jgi:peptidoglycan LD-endopeptidase CwlK
MLSKRSKSALLGVKPQLVAVVELAHAKLALRDDGLSFEVTEGLRDVARQQRLVAAGASRTLKSKHLTGDAVDLAATLDGKVHWDWPLYHRLAKAMKSAATELGVSIVWGGDWTNFRDGPHFEVAQSARQA